jgi:hypothetical protein
VHPRCRVVAPLLDAVEEDLCELLHLVRREHRRHLAAHGILGFVGAEPLVGYFVQVPEVRGAELLEVVGVETRPSQGHQSVDPLSKRHAFFNGIEVPRPLERDDTPARGGGEHRPFKVRLDDPREVVVERGDLGVGAGVGEVDGHPIPVAMQELARVEVPPEEGVDDQRHAVDEGAFVVREEVVLHCVSVVQRGLWIVEDHVGLWAQADAPHEAVEGGHGFLEEHDQLPALLVRFAERGLVLQATHRPPATSVIGLHEHGVAQLTSDGSQIEVTGVALEGDFQILHRLVGVWRDEPRLRYGEAQPDHPCERGQLLHRLDRPRVVEHIEVVEHHGLLDPLAPRMVPVGESVDDQVVLLRLPQVEGVDVHAFDVEANRVSLVGNGEVEPVQNVRVRDGPADVRA